MYLLCTKDKNLWSKLFGMGNTLDGFNVVTSQNYIMIN